MKRFLRYIVAPKISLLELSLISVWYQWTIDLSESIGPLKFLGVSLIAMFAIFCLNDVLEDK